jgi:DNA replication protein DnaC
MVDNKKEKYAHAINSYTKNIIEGLIPKRIVPFDYYEGRNIDEEVKNWIERSDGGFAVIVGDAGFGKTSLLCNLANALLSGAKILTKRF